MPQGETEPLLPRYEEPQHDFHRLRRLQQKLHTYQILRALSQGYMPSNDQIIANLRILQATDLLNPRNQDFGTLSRQLIRDARQWIEVFVELVREKNDDDKLQEFLWHVSQSRASLDTSHVSQRASIAKTKTDAKAAYNALRAVGSLFLSNADFRLFMDDLATVGRQVFSDSASSLSSSAQQVADKLQPPTEQLQVLEGAGADEGHTPTHEDLRGEASLMAEAVEDGVARTGQETMESAREHLSGRERETLIHRLKQAVLRLRERTDYSESVESLSKLIQRYASSYTDIAGEITAEAGASVETNQDVKLAVQQFWGLLQSLGDANEWKSLEQKFHQVLTHAKNDPEFENLISEIGTMVQNMLTNPESLDSASEDVEQLKRKANEVGVESNLRQDLDEFLAQAKRTLRSVSDDAAVSKLTRATTKLYTHAYDGYYDRKRELAAEVANIFIPILIRNIQYIPIPRLEISAPEMDLLVENLVLEPGHTVNYSSFLPFRTHITTRSDFDIVKKHSKRTVSDLKTTFTVTLLGLNVAAEEFGYWIRHHSGILRFNDEGKASFFLDRRGIDISLDVEVGRQSLEQIFTLRGVRVRIHKLHYIIHRSKWRWLLWILKPLLKHRVRRMIEQQIAEKIVSIAHTLNRELLFARERLRAARMANPPDLASFVRAVLARLSTTDDGDVEAGIGEDVVGHGIFRGVYTPGSIVKMWHEEVSRAQEAVEEGDETHGLGKTWRNEIFDVISST